MPYHEPPENAPRPSRPPLIALGPIAWEDANLGAFQRLFGTLAATFRPIQSLRAVAHGPIGPAIAFFVLSGLPWMLLWGILPFTHTLLFGHSFDLKVVGNATQPQIVPDVIRASGVGFVMSCLSFLSWALPFASLTKAFCASPPHAEEAHRAAWRSALYRGWIIPFGFAMSQFLLWAWPVEPTFDSFQLVVLLCQLAPRLLILIHCQAMARYVGASTLGALAVALVPVALDWAVGLLLAEGATSFLPPQAKP